MSVNVQLTLVRVHEPDAVRAIIREALLVDSELDPDGDYGGHVFVAACDLLGARVPIMPQATPLSGSFILPPGPHAL